MSEVISSEKKLDENPIVPEKRGRGRPRKVRRPRGRPKKYFTEDDYKEAKIKYIENYNTKRVKRPRGRPRKYLTEDEYKAAKIKYNLDYYTRRLSKTDVATFDIMCSDIT